MAEVRMPKMGDSMEEGTILRWMKQEGETVAAEEPIAEVETDKANVEISADEAGKLSKIVVKAGETVPVGAVIAVIGEGASVAPAPAPRNGGGEAAPPTSVSSGDAVAIGEEGSAMTEAVAPGESLPSTVEAEESESEGEEADRVKASPLARRYAREQGVDLAQVKGTGGGVGRVVRRDIEAFLKMRGAPSIPAVAPSAVPAPTPAKAAGVAPTLAGQDTDISRMRKAIARRTVQSKQAAPHFYITMPVEMDRALDLLAEMNAQTPEQKVTVNDLIVKACAVALAKFPDVNVSFTPDEKIRRYDTINIGVAVGTEDGLRIPVLFDCGAKTLRQIAAETKALAGKAREGTLQPQEMSGGTFSVSNLGMFGVEEFSAIINPPESAILAVGAAMPEAVVGPDGGFAARRRMRVTLSCDHRTVDGLLGAKFLQEVRRLLESPLNLLA